jgi:signal transduction histidine kinase
MELNEHVFLSFFSPAVAERLAGCVQECSCDAGDVVFEEGSSSDCICLVLEGRVDICKRDPAGDNQAVATVEENDYFGEFGLLDKQPRSATALAATDCRLACIGVEDFHACLADASAKDVLHFAAHSVSKFRASNERYVEERLQRERFSLVGEMAGGIIHDFRNPFTVICLASSSLAQHYRDPYTQHFCGLIDSQIRRMEVMADDLLEFSRGETHVHIDRFNLRELLEHFEQLNREYLAESDVTLTVDILDREISADKDKLLRVLQNLVNNAVDAFKKGGGHVHISAEDMGDRVVLHVKDDGPGVPEEVRGRLFQAFATAGKEKGLGLGMAITKSIIDAHKGTIEFETETGSGTTFVVTLPSEQDGEAV